MPLIGPTRAQVHVDRPLTNISLATIQSAAAFVAGQTFPIVPVKKQSDLYFKYDRADFLRNEAAIRAPGTESAGSTYSIDHTGSYNASRKSLHHDVPTDIMDNADEPLDPLSDAAKFVIQKMLIRREVDWAASHFVTGVWANEDFGVDSGPVAGTSFLRWNDAASNPVEDVRAAMTLVHGTTGFRPNKLTLGRPVYDKLIDHPDIVGRLDRGQTEGTARVTREALAALFELDQVLVMDAVSNSALPGAAEATAFIGGKNALLTYSPATPSLLIPSAGYTFVWKGGPGGNNQGVATKRFFMEKEDSWRVESDLYYDMKLTASELGFFFLTAVA